MNILKTINSYVLLFCIAFSSFDILPNSTAVNEQQTTTDLLQKKQESNIYREFQYTVADLASTTYNLIALRDRSIYHPYLEMKESTKKIIDSIEDTFYKQGAYNAIVKNFKRDKAEAVENTIGLYKELAQKVGQTLPTSTGLILDEQKIDWLKAASQQIRKKYKTFKPTIKESYITSLKRILLLNRITRHWDLKTFNQLSTLIFPFAGVYEASKYFEGLCKDRKLNTTELRTLCLVYGINFAALGLSSFFSYLDIEKERLKKREVFRQSSKEEKELKKQLHTLIAHTGTGEIGLRKIAGIQDNNIIQELAWYSDWLQQPISYYGSRISIMLYGEPGNGKGIITKALSDESSTPMITISADDVRNKKMVLKLLAAEHIAEKRKEKSIIVFFDEIDLILTQKNTDALQEFLTLLDGTRETNPHVRILYMFATNHIERLDKRFLRPGRFKSKLYVGPPALLEQRYNLICDSMQEVFDVAPHEIASLLAEETKDLSRVAINEVILNTHNHALLVGEMPSADNFLYEVKKIKDVENHSSEQIA